MEAFVDLDETLIYTYQAHGIDSARKAVKYAQKNQSKVFVANGEIYFTKVRPWTHEFITHLHEMFNRVYLMTYGDRKFQEQALRSSGLYGRFNAYIYRSAIEFAYNIRQPVIECRYPILFDNMVLGHPVLNMKMAAMGVDPLVSSQHFVHVRPFEGDDNNGLRKALESAINRWGNWR